ncbi:alpha/beta hydrolase [Strepomyces sp. STD 3.1]|uniref:alpha/beta fold hydrolase n=1 Tax=Streptomyces sp. NPDC058985 TaxID=3346684 RepID=UPI001F486E62|nr:alpha/beta hydrolase [Streptomyces sp. STD 3.1]
MTGTSEAVTASPDRFLRLPNGARVCYRLDGEAGAPPVLLLGGLGEDLSAWSPHFVDTLVSRGLLVIRMDNRDCGRSTYVTSPPPSVLRQVLARPRHDAYTLADLALDSALLLEHLEVGPAHLVGRSMGGMIAQSIAARYPKSTRSLVSIYSTTGDPRVGRPTASTKLLLASSPPRTRAQAVRAHLRLTAHLAGTRYPADEVAEAVHAVITWDRTAGDGAAGIARQIQAIQASGDRTAELGAVTTPTLVIHGDRDLMVDPSGGHATAIAVAGARLLVVPGMGHHLPDSLADHVIGEIADHIATV